MKKETRTIVYDDEIKVQAYRFEGIVQPLIRFHGSTTVDFIAGTEIIDLERRFI